MDATAAVDAHERFWGDRAAALTAWQAAKLRYDRASARIDDKQAEMERALTCAAGGLTARQRAWAERHASYATRPRDRAGRQVLVTWTYRRARIDSTRARWTVLVDDAAAALAVAERELGETAAAVLRAWGPEAPALTATPRRQLRRWAEHTRPLAEPSDDERAFESHPR